MKAFFDTSVLIATFYADHEHHPASIDLFLRFKKHDACCGSHSLAEIFATLTGMPGRRRASGNEALLFLGDIRDRLTIISLDAGEYYQMLEASVEAGLSGGAVYDAILGHCALKAEAEVIYTWNKKDFQRLPPLVARRAKTPDQ